MKISFLDLIVFIVLTFGNVIFGASFFFKQDLITIYFRRR